MISSKINICNLALASIGEDSIKDFSEGNIRARMCDTFYENSRDYLLEQFDWPFARKQQALMKVASPTDWVPDGTFEYAKPVDCYHVISLWPEGSRQGYELRGKSVFCQLDSGAGTDVVLMYTVHELDPTKYSSGFINLLALAMAVRLCLPLTSDKALANGLLQQYELEKKEVWANAANEGNMYPSGNDENPNYDTFVRGPDYEVL